jgi:uroporphyrinogen-III synthase
MRILITRPQAAAERTAAKLTARGYTPLIAPVLTIVPSHEPAPLGDFDAVLATSINAFHNVDGLDADGLASLLHLPLLAVGTRTAKAAAEHGFADVRDAKGDASALARLAATTFQPGAHLLVMAGRERTDDLEPALNAAGLKLSLWIRYAAETAQSWHPEIVDIIKKGELDAVLHYSPRSAHACLALASQSGLQQQLRKARHITISLAVASVLNDSGMELVQVASQPDEIHMMRLLDIAGN